MPPYPISCSGSHCTRQAVYKIAARWSDGHTEELKTYCLSCEQCLPLLFRQSREKQRACRLAPHESLDPPGIFALERGRRDRQLHRLPELEQQFADTE